jgi:hypothetical protein
MDVNQEQRESLRLLKGLEDGDLPVKDCCEIAENRDAVLVSLIIRYLRRKYPSSHPDGAGVMSRLVELTSNYPAIVQKIKEGDEDPIREWFEETYEYREFFAKPEELIELVIDKIEG